MEKDEIIINQSKNLFKNLIDFLDLEFDLENIDQEMAVDLIACSIKGTIKELAEAGL